MNYSLMIIEELFTATSSIVGDVSSMLSVSSKTCKDRFVYMHYVFTPFPRKKIHNFLYLNNSIKTSPYEKSNDSLRICLFSIFQLCPYPTFYFWPSFSWKQPRAIIGLSINNQNWGDMKKSDSLRMWENSWFFQKGGSKVCFLGQGGVCNSAPKGPNDLKFCMQGAFVCYYWVLVKSRSCDLYRGQSHLEARTGLAIIEVAWTWLDQNSIVTHKSPLHAKFQVIWSIGDWVTGTPLSKNPDFAPPLLVHFTKLLFYLDL